MLKSCPFIFYTVFFDGFHIFAATEDFRKVSFSSFSQFFSHVNFVSLSKMEKDGVIRFIREENKRKIYELTELGEEVLSLELRRIERLYRNSREEAGNE